MRVTLEAFLQKLEIWCSKFLLVNLLSLFYNL